jgi:hypothetical protein
VNLGGLTPSVIFGLPSIRARKMPAETPAILEVACFEALARPYRACYEITLSVAKLHLQDSPCRQCTVPSIGSLGHTWFPMRVRRVELP